MDVSENSGTPKSSILIEFSMIFTIHFGGNTPIFGATPIISGTTSRSSHSKAFLFEGLYSIVVFSAKSAVSRLSRIWHGDGQDFLKVNVVHKKSKDSQFWSVPVFRWWQLKYFLFSTRSLGKIHQAGVHSELPFGTLFHSFRSHVYRTSSLTKVLADAFTCGDRGRHGHPNTRKCIYAPVS